MLAIIDERKYLVTFQEQVLKAGEGSETIYFLEDIERKVNLDQCAWKVLSWRIIYATCQVCYEIVVDIKFSKLWRESPYRVQII